MRKFPFLGMVCLLLFAACAKQSVDDHGHPHEEGGLEPLAYTLYSDKTELFVEFKPLVVGQTSKFAAHFTILGDTFRALTEGKVTVSLIVGANGIRNSADTCSSPGIYRLALEPSAAGKGKLVFDIVTPRYTDKIEIDGVDVFANEQAALDAQVAEADAGEISYLKEQAWKVEFANMPLKRVPFNDVIRTSGQVLSAPGDEIMVTAKSNGILRFSGSSAVVGSPVSSGAMMFAISGGGFAEGNVDDAYASAKVTYEKADAELRRATELVKDKLISEQDFQQAKLEFERSRIAYQTLARSHSGGGQTVTAPMSGFVKNILVKEGQFVAAGTPLATLSKNQKLILQANVSQRHFHQLSLVSSANFKMAGSDKVYSTRDLNGRVLSFGKSTSAETPFLPVTFEIDNIGDIIPGSVAEVYLLSSPIPNAIVIPVSALIEEQGVFYAYVQSSGEGFQKRELMLGASDGMQVQVINGLAEGERVVTMGAYQIKLATASGSVPAHGHEH